MKWRFDPVREIGDYAPCANFAFSAATTFGGAKGEASPPIEAIWRTRVAVIGLTGDEAGRKTVRNGRHRAVHPRHLHFEVEIGRVRKPRMIRVAPEARAASTASPVKAMTSSAQDSPYGDWPGRLADHRQPLFDAEEPRLVRIGTDADHQPVAQCRGVLDDVEMPVGHRVEGAGEEARADHAGKALARRVDGDKGAVASAPVRSARPRRLATTEERT